MRRARVHRHLERSQQWLGIEMVDALALGLVLWLLVTLQFSLPIVAAVLAVAYGTLRIWKRGKPPGYTLALARYTLQLRKRWFLSAAAPDRLGRKHPFQPQKGGADTLN